MAIPEPNLMDVRRLDGSWSNKHNNVSGNDEQMSIFRHCKDAKSGQAKIQIWKSLTW